MMILFTLKKQVHRSAKSIPKTPCTAVLLYFGAFVVRSRRRSAEGGVPNIISQLSENILTSNSFFAIIIA